MKFEAKWNILLFISKKRIWKCRLQNVRHFVQTYKRNLTKYILKSQGYFKCLAYLEYAEYYELHTKPWWHHQMETISALLAPCWNSVPSEFLSRTPVTQSFDVFFDLPLNKRLSKHSSASYFRLHRAHYDVTVMRGHRKPRVAIMPTLSPQVTPQLMAYSIQRLAIPHYSDVIMSAMASQITLVSIVCSVAYSGADQRKLQRSASLAFVRESTGDTFSSDGSLISKWISIIKIRRPHDHHIFMMWILYQGLYSLSGKTSYCKISWSLEVARFGFRLFQSLWNLTGPSAAALPRCLSNFRAVR